MSFILLLSCVLLGIVLIIFLTSVLKFNAFLSIFLTSLILAVVALPVEQVIPTIVTGFGDTMRSIGLIIILGIILGILLDKSGATKSIAKAVLKLTGVDNAGFAIHSTGFITGIPIFCDSGFIVLHGINRKLVQTTGKSMVFMSTVLAAGLYPVHCMIPPHPGATAAAGIMGANIGKLIIFGVMVALFAALCGFLWARFMCRKETALNRAPIKEPGSNTDDSELPSTLLSFLPIIVPLLLLTGRSVILLLPHEDEELFFKIANLIGEPVFALLIGNILAVMLFKKVNVVILNNLLDLSIEKAGSILAITAAGGIFGTVIKNTGVGDVAGNYLATTGLGLFIPFLIAAFLKTAQGSSTVAVMTAASIVAPMLTALNLNSQNGIILATMAMGAGSMIVSHTNDSYFWVVTKFSDLEPKSTLKVYTTTTLILGISAFAAVLAISQILL